MAFFQKRQTTENERRKALGKFKRKRWLAGAMAFMLCCTSFLQTGVLAVSAQDEIVQEEVQTLKSEEELIEETAVDPALAITLEQGKAFDVQKDVTGLNLKEGEQMELKKAEMEDGTPFDPSRPGVYRCVYRITPKSGEAYLLARTITVTEKEPETKNTGESEKEESGNSEDPDPLPELSVEVTEETDPALYEQQETQNLESELTAENAETPVTVEEPIGSEDSETGDSSVILEAPVDVEEATDSQKSADEVQEPADQTETTEEVSQPEDSESSSESDDFQSEILPEEEFDADLERAEEETTVDPETGLTLGEVLEQAEEQQLDLMSMEEGETASFIATYASTTTDVSVTRGTCYYYSDYDLGSYLTYKYTVSFGNVTATAYCIEPSKNSPGDGVFKITKLGDGKKLAKVCYYGTKASGVNGFFKTEHPDFSAGKQFVITHLAVSYASGNSDAFSGANSTGQALAMELYNYCMAQPEIPDVAMEFSSPHLVAYFDGEEQRTEETKFKADALQNVTLKLPKGVKFHNVDTGEVSEAGANVKVYGGTTFYLSAPLSQASDVAAFWETTMKGYITKDFSAYKITTGTDTQNLALVFGEGVDDEKYVDLDVTWLSQATIKIIKKDKGTNALLAGAVYGVYSDAECQNLIVEMPATDEKGESSVTINKTQDVVYLKEITGPAGYLVDIAAHDVSVVMGDTVTKELVDEEQMASLTVYKEGEVLTGATVANGKVTFVYEMRRQKGAIYNVYAEADIVAADGTTVYQKGALVKENLITGEDGSATLENLHVGTYTVTEMQAPDTLVCTGESKTVTLTAGEHAEVQVRSVSFTNDRQKASVSLVKQDGDTQKPLSGAFFGLYAGNDITSVDGMVVVAKDTLIENVSTGTDGKAAYQADLPVNNSYYIKELQAPQLYVLNDTDTYSFTFSYAGDREAYVEFSHTFTDERVRATIQLSKEDKETGKNAQGDATLEGAVYGLYAREDIGSPDGASGILYPAGTQVATLTTDSDGAASVSDLYPGKYYVKEITPPVGYLPDEDEHDIECSYEGDKVKEITRSITVYEDVKKQPFQLIKAANNGKTDADLLKGAGFSAYLVSSLTVKEDGTYDFANATSVVLTEDGKTEIFTDEKGYACTIPLPYGTYVVRETTTPHNFKPVDDFQVVINENKLEPQVWRVLLDGEFSAKLKIIKQDDETKKPVLLANTEFKIYDLDAKKYVEQTTTYPSTVTHKSYFTDENGYLILPSALKCGNYRIEEVTAPEGYTQNTNYVEIQVDSNTAYQMDSVTGDAIITVVYENHPAKGKLVIKKSGETLKAFKKDFEYEKTSLAGAEFAIYAAEDIYTPDHQRDEQGNRLVIYPKDTLVQMVITDEEGKAVLGDLPLGTYRVEETKAPVGFVLNAESQEITFLYKDQNTPVIEETLEFSNKRQKVEIKVTKEDAETGKKLEGAVFGIYNKNDILAGGKVLVKADTLLQKITSDKNGLAQFTLDLPLGKYYVKELTAPDGYVSSEEVLEFDAGYQGQEVKVVKLSATKKNQPTTVEITKADLTTGVELDGASLIIMNQKGEVVDSWTSVKEKPHVIKSLKVGETYTLREQIAPYGYLKTTDITFQILDTAEVQKVKMEDDVPIARLLVNKKGEFLDHVTLLDNAKGVVEHFFGYITGNLTNVTFNVYAAEAIRAADGVSKDYYAKDELVGTISTDGTGVAQLDNLPLGKYYIVEKETSYGYVLDDEPRYVDLTYRDQDTPVVTYSADWQNRRQKIQVNVLKKEKDSDKVLSGAIFGLFAAEDIVSSSGKVLIEKDTIIELKTTDESGWIHFIADLPISAKYYLKELYAPNGYVREAETQEFTFEYQGDNTTQAVYEFTFEDVQTSVELSKADLTDGKELPGASLQVLDSNGTVVEEWISIEEPHMIRGLLVGSKYTLVETKPADGYTTAESIEFTVEDTVEIQKHQMLDDITKVEISKTDITDSKEVPGAKLTILDKDGKEVESWVSEEKPHLIEKLPIGTYTLKEEQAPEGYLIAEDVIFKVKDTGEIQKVEMKDARPVGRLVLKKTDAGSGEALAGAEFELRIKESGKVAATLVTDEEGTARSEELPIATYKDRKMEKAIEYVLVETKAPEGYVRSEKEESVIFAYEDGNTKEIEIIKELTNERIPTGGYSNSPKTGDDTNIWLPFFLLLLSVGGIAGIIWYTKRKNHD